MLELNLFRIQRSDMNYWMTINFSQHLKQIVSSLCRYAMKSQARRHYQHGSGRCLFHPIRIKNTLTGVILDKWQSC